ncbi:MAG: hypothetical protein HZA46_21980 [Planctomycetales bacterium]|nr:hypothetical protein [Planctomycetales bacterium]
MATAENRQLSVVQLQRLLERRSAELNRLERMRIKLRKQLDNVEGKITAVGGADSAGKAGPKRRKSHKRHKNEKSLKVLVTEILGQSKKGLTLKQLTDKVLSTGYKTSSANFPNTVYQAVYNSEGVSFDEASGLYRAK